MFCSRSPGGLLMAAGILFSVLAGSARATVTWTGNPSSGTGVFKVLDLEDPSHTFESNPSPNGSSITTGTDPTFGPQWQFDKVAADLRAEAHGANGVDPSTGNTYYIGWRFKVSSTVTDNAVFQWKAYGTPLNQNYPIVLKFVNGNLQLHYFAPGTIDNLLWSNSEAANVWNNIVIAITVSALNVTSGPQAGAISFWWDGTEENLGGEGNTYVGSTFDGTSVDPKWEFTGRWGRK
jgi:hypothetical protein